MGFTYAVMLDLQGQNVLVVGGGHVAARKVSALCEAGACVKVIAPKICDEIYERQDVLCEKRCFELEDIEHARPFAVFAATDDPAVNRMIAERCKERQILVNTITDPFIGNFSVQSKILRQDYAVSISTFGHGPGFSRELREYLESVLDDRMDRALKIYLDMRAWLRETVQDSDERVSLLRCLHLEDIIAIVDIEPFDYDECIEKVKKWLSCS